MRKPEFINIFETQELRDKYNKNRGLIPSEIIKIYGDVGVNYKTSSVIPPSGKVQVFANPQCTEYATGYCQDVWVRLNQDFGYNDAIDWRGDNDGSRLLVGTPTNEVPSDPYSISVWIDWTSEEFNEPFTAGQIIKCSFYDVGPNTDNVQVIFE